MSVSPTNGLALNWRPVSAAGNSFGSSIALREDGFVVVGAPTLFTSGLSGSALAFSTSVAAGVLVVDDDYCAAGGFPSFDGRCIANALADANVLVGAYSRVEIQHGNRLLSRRCAGCTVCGKGWRVGAHHRAPLLAGTYVGCPEVDGTLISRNNLVVAPVGYLAGNVTTSDASRLVWFPENYRRSHGCWLAF